jgi:hypothetical protein
VGHANFPRNPEIFQKNRQIPAIKKLKFYENFIIASATYGQLAKKISAIFNL